MANLTSPFATTNLTAHDSYFEPIIGILPGRIKGQYLTPVKKKYPSSTFYKYGWIPWFERGENQVQSQQKIADPSFVSTTIFSLSLSLRRFFSHFHLNIVVNKSDPTFSTNPAPHW
jgi:hypothetical protein